jgi:ribosome maturation factor RimP
MLDEADPIPGIYVFEVSSAGAERALKRRGISSALWASGEVRLYKPLEGPRLLWARSAAMDDGGVRIETAAGTQTFEKKQVDRRAPAH